MKVSVYLLIGLLSGCIMPIPHKRVSVIGIEGIVCDSDTGAPILGASVSVMYSGKSKIVFTDEQGRYKVEEEKSWHGAYFIGIPVSFSLFPVLDAPLFPCAIFISADGYASWRWQSWSDIDEVGNLENTATGSGMSCVKLKKL